MIHKRGNCMRSILLVSVVLFAMTMLTACSDEGFPEIVEDKKITHHVGEEAQMSTHASSRSSWQDEIITLASNGESASLKLEALEQFATQYVTNEDELAQFTTNIITDYEAYAYLQQPAQHKEMLTRIFQAFIVERNATAHLKDFMRAYYINVTSIYTAQLVTDDAIIKQNEAVMAHMLAKYTQ